MQQFDHEKLHAYQVAIELVVLINEMIKNLPRGNSHLSDQLHRASTSIPLNIAEGAGEFSKNEKIRFYRIAKRSATECASILDICHRLSLIGEKNTTKARDLLIRIVSMLTKMEK